MADISDTNRSEVTRLVGADPASGAETNTLIITTNNEAASVDRLDNGGADTSVSVTAGSPIEVKVGGSNRTERKMLILQPDGKILFGFSPSTQNFRVFKDQIVSINLGPNTSLYVDAVSGSVDVSIGEAS